MASVEETPEVWVHARGLLGLQVPRVMAVVNLTPDSFFDGGNLMPPGGEGPNAAMTVRRCHALIQQGADILDIGGESTRPGAEPVPLDQELRRVMPALAAMLRDPIVERVPISVDTRHAEVAAQVLAMGAAIINDISGMADPEMAAVVARSRAGLVLGHLRGEPMTMQASVQFADLLGDVTRELGDAVERALQAGVARAAIVVDPGIGFGKSFDHSAALVASAAALRRALGVPVLIGASRKGFLGAITGAAVDRRLIASVAAAVVAVERGANIVRVHDVGATVEALQVTAAIAKAHAAAATIADTRRAV